MLCKALFFNHGDKIGDLSDDCYENKKAPEEKKETKKEEPSKVETKTVDKEPINVARRKTIEKKK